MVVVPRSKRRASSGTQLPEDIIRSEYKRKLFSDPVFLYVPRDPKDNFILATLIAGKAEYLVTGDADLLALRDRYPVLTPAEFAQRL